MNKKLLSVLATISLLLMACGADDEVTILPIEDNQEVTIEPLTVEPVIIEEEGGYKAPEVTEDVVGENNETIEDEGVFSESSPEESTDLTTSEPVNEERQTEKQMPLVIINMETGEAIPGSEAGPGSDYEKQSALDMANFRVRAGFSGADGPEELRAAMKKFDDYTDEAIDYAVEHVEAPWN